MFSLVTRLPCHLARGLEAVGARRALAPNTIGLMSCLTHDPRAPFQATASRILAEHGHFRLRSDQVAWPDGMTADYTVVEGPIAVVVVAVGVEGGTGLGRQWRPPRQQTSLELP